MRPEMPSVMTAGSSCTGSPCAPNTNVWATADATIACSASATKHASLPSLISRASWRLTAEVSWPTAVRISGPPLWRGPSPRRSGFELASRLVGVGAYALAARPRAEQRGTQRGPRPERLGRKLSRWLEPVEGGAGDLPGRARIEREILPACCVTLRVPGLRASLGHDVLLLVPIESESCHNGEQAPDQILLEANLAIRHALGRADQERMRPGRTFCPTATRRV